MSIQLSMEIPTCMLEDWAPLVDIDFVLAHKVLADSAYAEFFAQRALTRELILDNSYHELGVPLDMDDLLEAAHLCRANYIITPDRVGDPQFNVEQFKLGQQALVGYGLAVVMTGAPGSSSADREVFLANVLDADMLCCTFKEPQRLQWYRESILAKRWRRVHLLGVSELFELGQWAVAAADTRPQWSVDTGKALKWALKGKRLDELDSLRTNAATTQQGKPSKVSQEILELRRSDIMPHHDELLKYNVEVLRRCCK